MTKEQMCAQQNEQEATIIELQMLLQYRTDQLEIAQSTIDAQTAKLDDGQALIDDLEDALELAHVSHEQVCRRCFGTFSTSNEDMYCSRDCQEFRRQEPFARLWSRLHPNGQYEPVRAMAKAAHA